MRLRVVCGLEVTIAIFCPTSRFTSVDFPAFGRPRIATKPERNIFPSAFFEFLLRGSRSATQASCDGPHHAPVQYVLSGHLFLFLRRPRLRCDSVSPRPSN